MKIFTDKYEKTLDKPFLCCDIDKLSENAVKMLELIYNFPGMNTLTIQRRLKFESKHTLLKYMKELLENELVKFQRNIKDKRQKQFNLTEKGHYIRERIIRDKMESSLLCYIDNCNKMFLIKHPVYKNSKKWIKFVQKGYSNDFIGNIEYQVFSYILNMLKSD
jgi:DNA-binding MarR family transcriptional regulator